MSLFRKIVFIKLYDRTCLYHTVLLLISLHFESSAMIRTPETADEFWKEFSEKSFEIQREIKDILSIEESARREQLGTMKVKLDQFQECIPKK